MQLNPRDCLEPLSLEHSVPSPVATETGGSCYGDCLPGPANLELLFQLILRLRGLGSFPGLPVSFVQSLSDRLGHHLLKWPCPSAEYIAISPD